MNQSEKLKELKVLREVCEKNYEDYVYRRKRRYTSYLTKKNVERLSLSIILSMGILGVPVIILMSIGVIPSTINLEHSIVSIIVLFICAVVSINTFVYINTLFLENYIGSRRKVNTASNNLNCNRVYYFACICDYYLNPAHIDELLPSIKDVSGKEGLSASRVSALSRSYYNLWALNSPHTDDPHHRVVGRLLYKAGVALTQEDLKTSHECLYLLNQKEEAYYKSLKGKGEINGKKTKVF